MSTRRIFPLIIAGLISLVSYAQDGQGLFKSRCNSCHMEDANSTGPKLKGAKALWEKAGEGEMIYDWITNPAALIKSGKSSRAKEIQSYSAAEMPAQTSSKEEIDAILAYVDSYEPAPLNAVDSSATNKITPIKPNYNRNLDIFYGLIALAFIIALAILVIALSIVTFVKSDFFKERATQQNLLPIIILVISFGYMGYGSNLLALDFIQPGELKEKGPWLLVENSDLYILLFVNIVLLSVFFYLRHIFQRLVAMTKPAEVVKIDGPVFKKINAVLTDVIPLEREHEIMMDHDYDGIRELDNNLPPWWVWGFYATIVFAFIYLINYHVVGYSDLQIKAYDKEISVANKEVSSYLASQAMNVDESNVTLMTESKDLSQGKALFATHCVTCHKANGEGDVGPNLTDKAWVYGFEIKDVFTSIKKGRPAGMPEHASKLNPIQIQQISSFVINLPYTKGTKPEQGTIFEK